MLALTVMSVVVAMHPILLVLRSREISAKFMRLSTAVTFLRDSLSNCVPFTNHWTLVSTSSKLRQRKKALPPGVDTKEGGRTKTTIIKLFTWLRRLSYS